MTSGHGHELNLGPAESRQLGELGPKAARLGIGVAAAGLVVAALVAIFTGQWHQFARAYLFGFLVILTISLGGLFFTILQHIVKAGWSVVVRRIAEGLASNLRWIWVLFIPIVIATFTTDLYHWMHPVHDGHVDGLLVHKAPYFFWPLHYELHVPAFWLVRAVLFFGVWAFLANFFITNSAAQDATGDAELTRKMEWYAPLGMLFYAATQTFAAFDWVMSLEPHWFSTMFPVYFFAASCVGAFSCIILTVYLLQRNGRLVREITVEHYQDLGKLLFAFAVVFWAYIAYSQYMLIWYANLPETTGWFLARTIHGWGGVALLLLAGHFMIPFVILITKHTKRMKPVLAGAAAWMLFMHVVDVYWLSMPIVPHQALLEVTNRDELVAQTNNEMLGFNWQLLDLLCVAGMLGLLVAGTARRLGSASLIPEQDPRLGESLVFENV